MLLESREEGLAGSWTRGGEPRGGGWAGDEVWEVLPQVARDFDDDRLS